MVESNVNRGEVGEFLGGGCHIWKKTARGISGGDSPSMSFLLSSGWRKGQRGWSMVSEDESRGGYS